MKNSRIIVWFRNDLRVSDQEALCDAIKFGHEIVPVYCFDPRMFEETELGFPKTGVFRTKFLLESVTDLRKSLRKMGADLVILNGKPEKEIPSFAKKIGANSVFFSKEIASEEIKVEKALEKEASRQGLDIKSFWQSTLFHPEDLPFSIIQTPEVFTQFRKEVEKHSFVRKTLPTPEKIIFPGKELIPDSGEIPTLNSFGFEVSNLDSRSGWTFQGGEESAISRLESYFWLKDLLKTYKDTRNGLIGMDYSSKFSPWLSMGCISPRKIFEEVKIYEEKRHKNQSTYWLIFELIWRDYFKFIAQKHGNSIFKIGGIKNLKDNWNRDTIKFQSWVEGKTGVPFIDANMRELQQTGYMSNRGRQNAASFLVNDLGIDWTWGASYFESQLMDYDVCSNWGNWMYVAGVGNDPRENRYFNILKQGKNYDPNGDFIRLWIPELRKIKGFDIHQPWKLSTSKLNDLKIQMGQTYPHPIVNTLFDFQLENQ